MTNSQYNELKKLVESNDKVIQAMLEKQATFSLKRKEEKAQYQKQMADIQASLNCLDDTLAGLSKIEEGYQSHQ